MLFFVLFVAHIFTFAIMFLENILSLLFFLVFCKYNERLMYTISIIVFMMSLHGMHICDKESFALKILNFYLFSHLLNIEFNFKKVKHAC